MAGPLNGLTIVEFAGIGPAPFAAMMLADHGATVIRIEREGLMGIPNDPLLRSRRSIALDLKSDSGREIALRLASRADGLIEGYRPGVMERLGLGPDKLLGDNPRMVYGRVTGWGQDGLWAQRAGHDINYLALSGLLHTIGTAERPVVPSNYLADFAGGGMMLAFAMVSALFHVQRGGGGQVIDASMVEGSALIGALCYGMHSAGLWSNEREANLLDGGLPAYAVYRCADGKFLAVGALEPQFRAALTGSLGLFGDPGAAELADLFAARGRDEWIAWFGDRDICVSPVLDLDEAPTHPHMTDRQAFTTLDGVVQPAPAPRYSSSRSDPPTAPRSAGADGRAILAELGYSEDLIAELHSTGAVRSPG